MRLTPLGFFPAVGLLLLAAGAAGTWVRRQYPGLVERENDVQFAGLQAAVLALLGLLVGFSFSMAVGRSDERRRTQMEEANAISTAFLRAGTGEDKTDGDQRRLLAAYVRSRMEFLAAGEDRLRLKDAADQAAGRQEAIWAAARRISEVRRGDPVSQAYLGSLTEMFDASERTQSAFENRIPTLAWVLLVSVATMASFLVGMGLMRWNALMLVTLPLVMAATLTLIYDIDSPRLGLIRQSQESMKRLERQVLGGTSR